MKKRPRVSVSDDFFDYFPAAEPHHRWGIYATSFGQVRTLAGSFYPPSAHPQNHFLSWDKGRVLQQYQILYISEGEGQFESEFSPLIRVKKGTLFLLFPGIWHRYRPDPKLGWTEFWIELGGRQMEELHRLKEIDPRKPLHVVGEIPEILGALATARQLTRVKAPGFQVRVGILGLQILTYVTWRAALPGSSSHRIELVVQEALNLLGSNLDQALSPERIARELHVGYSYFRRVFKAQTGFSPKQYRLEIRFRRTCDFLRNTEMTIKEIAGQLNYDSPFHLSVDFKKRASLSPHRWRKRERDRSVRYSD